MKTTCSFYVYLSVIAIVDLFMCVIIFLSGLAKGILSKNSSWAAFDSLIFFPITEFLNCINATATIFVTIDRVIYLRKPTQTCKPKFCQRREAMKVMLFLSMFSAIYTIPNGFIYKLNLDGTLYYTAFYESIYFTIYNWMDIIVFAIIPVIVLLVGNTILFLSIRNACHTLKQCQKKLAKGKVRVIMDQTKITITLMAIVVFYLIGEVPTRFTKKTSAANILFGGDEEKANESIILEYARQVTTVLNALHLAIKFILYAFFCPPFYKSLRKAMCHYSLSKNRVQIKSLPINVFFVDDFVLKSMERCYKFDFSKFKTVSEFLTTKNLNLPRMY
ncbi:hypothetical protein RN001_000046 [Aquatica leii]|uniref:G-protein coupled receptors family 1 profile domain-containing protein n=1 Tax=Aquatica leii TaxID=1421715 RepID=A0AAN7Q9C5_9COLE|nr:hypothetical protein RN001_000046 [Aquatica leii]